MKAIQYSRIHLVATALLLLPVPLLVSCRGSDAPNRPTTAPAATQGQTSRAMGEHWVKDEQLRRVMQELSLKLQRHTPGSLQQDPEDAVDKEAVEQSFRQAEQLADGLAGAAVRIPATVDPAKMGEAQHTEFRRLADTLRDNSFKLREAAGAKNIERMQQELRAVNSTCIDCHRQFRDFAGVIDSTRASAD
jgi:hypothetical protein